MDRSSGLLWSAIAAVAAVLLVGAYFGTKLALEAAPAAAGPHRLQSSGKWDRYVAPDSWCPGSDDLGASVVAQERTELCLLNYARGVKGLGPLNIAPALMRSAHMKADDIVRCNQFAHDACGFDVRQRFADSGYFRSDVPSRFGENLAWGGAEAGSPRGALLGWLDSPKHRANLFKPDWTEQGIALVYRPRFRGVASSRIWVSHFGHQG
ncbi:MAG TPA: CAP domain-containing protein [Gaiellaceae bacterium]|nr:CAP domain-containing protein [Gaiellaceae bacterium]